MSRQHSEALFTGRAIAFCPELARVLGHSLAAVAQQLYWLSRRTEDGFVRLTMEQWGDEVGCDASTASRAFAKLAERRRYQVGREAVEALLVDVDESQARKGYRPRYSELLALVPNLSLTPKAVDAALQVAPSPPLQIATPDPPAERDCEPDGPASLEGRGERQEQRAKSEKEEAAATYVTEQENSTRESGQNGDGSGEPDHDLAQVEAALVASLRAPERRGATR